MGCISVAFVFQCAFTQALGHGFASFCFCCIQGRPCTTSISIAEYSAAVSDICVIVFSSWAQGMAIYRLRCSHVQFAGSFRADSDVPIIFTHNKGHQQAFQLLMDVAFALLVLYHGLVVATCSQLRHVVCLFMELCWRLRCDSGACLRSAQKYAISIRLFTSSLVSQCWSIWTKKQPCRAHPCLFSSILPSALTRRRD